MGVRLWVEIDVPPAPVDERDPEGYTLGFVAGVLLSAGLVARVTRGSHLVDDDEPLLDLGPGVAAALAEAASHVELAGLHHCPIAGCDYAHHDRRGVATHLRGHSLELCEWCGSTFKSSGLGAHKSKCPYRPGGPWRPAEPAQSGPIQSGPGEQVATAAVATRAPAMGPRPVPAAAAPPAPRPTFPAAQPTVVLDELEAGGEDDAAERERRRAERRSAAADALYEA